MARYSNTDELINWCNETYKAQTTVVGKGYVNAFLQAVVMSETEDVVPRSEVKDLEYKLTGVMLSVDKWLDGDELNQEEVNRAITMREKTLRIVEELQEQNDILDKRYTDAVDELEKLQLKTCEYIRQAKQEVASEIFEEIEKLLDRHSHSQCFQGEICPTSYFEKDLEDSIAELKKEIQRRVV